MLGVPATYDRWTAVGRIAGFFALFLPLSLLAQVAVSVAPPATFDWLARAALLTAALAAGWIMLVRFDGRPMGALGFAMTPAVPREIASGLLLGALLIAVATLLLLVTGAAYFVPDSGTPLRFTAQLVSAFAFFGVAAAYEEALFRGYPFQVLVAAFGVWPATLAASALFSWIHGNNPGITPIAFANIFLAGVLLSLAYLRTRSLWFATAVHLGWNWMMATVLDFPVSGLNFDTPLYSAVEEGADWWTGGAFGPEAGLAGTVPLAAGAMWLARTQRLRPGPENQGRGALVDGRLARHEA